MPPIDEPRDTRSGDHDEVWSSTSISELKRRLSEVARVLDGIDSSVDSLKLDMAVLKVNLTDLGQRQAADQDRISKNEEHLRKVELDRSRLAEVTVMQGVEHRVGKLERTLSGSLAEQDGRSKGQLSMRDWVAFIGGLIIVISTLYTAFHVHG